MISKGVADMRKLANLRAYNFCILYRNGKNDGDPLSTHPVELESDSNDGIIANEVKAVSIQGMSEQILL